jgi:hypothetical protein
MEWKRRIYTEDLSTYSFSPCFESVLSSVSVTGGKQLINPPVAGSSTAATEVDLDVKLRQNTKCPDTITN